MMYKIKTWLPAWNNSHYDMTHVLRTEIDQQYCHELKSQDTIRYRYMLRQLCPAITGYSMDAQRSEKIMLFQSVYTCAVVSPAYPNVLMLFIKKDKYSFLDELIQISNDNNIKVVFTNKTVTFYNVPFHAYYYMIDVIIRGGKAPLNIYDKKYIKPKAILPTRNTEYLPAVNSNVWFSLLYRWYYNDIREKFQLYFKKDIYNMTKTKTRVTVQELRKEFNEYIFHSHNHVTIREFFKKVDVYNRYFFHIYKPRHETTDDTLGFRLPNTVLYSYLLQLMRIISRDLFDSLKRLNTYTYIRVPERYFVKQNKQKPLPIRHATIEDGMSNIYNNSYRVIRTGDSLTDYYIDKALEYHFFDYEYDY